MSLRPAAGCAAPIAACAALTSDDLPMPRAPQSSALLAGRPRAKRSVFSTRRSRTRSMPLSSDISTRLTRRTGASRAVGVPDKGLGGGEFRRVRAGPAPAAPARRRCAPRSAPSEAEAAAPAVAAIFVRLRDFCRVWRGLRMKILSVADPLAGRGNARKRRAAAPAHHCNWTGGGYSPRDFARKIGPLAWARAPERPWRTNVHYARLRAKSPVALRRRGAAAAWSCR